MAAAARSPVAPARAVPTDVRAQSEPHGARGPATAVIPSDRIMANWGDLPDDLRDMIVHEATEGPNSDYSWQRNYNGALRLLNTPPWEGGPNNLEEANYYHRIMDDAARFVRDRRRERWRAYVHPGVREMPVPAGEDFHPDANRLTPMERVRYAAMGVAGVVYGVHRLTKAETNLQPDTKKAQQLQSPAQTIVQPAFEARGMSAA